MPERVDRRPRIRTKSWGEIIDSEHARVQSLKDRASALLQMDPKAHEGVRVSEAEFETTWGAYTTMVFLDATTEELKTAPTPIKRVLKDLGIKLTDNVTVGLEIPSSDLYRFRVEPQPVRDD